MFIQTLTTLSLSQNEIHADGAQHLANGLRQSTVSFISLPIITKSTSALLPSVASHRRYLK